MVSRKKNLIKKIYRIIKTLLNNQEVSFYILKILLKSESFDFLIKIYHCYKSEQYHFKKYLASVKTVDEFLSSFYQISNNKRINSFILKEIQSLSLRSYLSNLEEYLNLSSSEDPIKKEIIPFKNEVFYVSGDIFSYSKEISENPSTQYNFIYLWKHCIYLFQDRIDYKTLSAWIEILILYKESEKSTIKEFLKNKYPSPFKNLIQVNNLEVIIQGLLSFIYLFWPLILINAEEFFNYIIWNISSYLQILHSSEAIALLYKIKESDYLKMFLNPEKNLDLNPALTSHDKYFHITFLDISEKNRQKAFLDLKHLSDSYVKEILPETLKYKIPSTWKEYSQSLKDCYNFQILSTKIVKESFAFKLMQKKFWQSFEETLNFTPLKDLKHLPNEYIQIFCALISEHIHYGRKIWGSNWICFYLEVSRSPQVSAFQILLRYFKDLLDEAQAHKLIYLLSSVSIISANHFFLVFQIIAHMNVIDHPQDPTASLKNSPERNFILKVLPSSFKTDWINSFIIINSLKNETKLKEHLITKLTSLSLADIENFNPYSPVILWLFSQSEMISKKPSLIHSERENLLAFIDYLKINGT